MKTRPSLLSICIVAATAAIVATRSAVATTPIEMVSDPALSPDGKQIAFSWNGDIWSVASEGGVAVQLTTDEARDSQPKFSPDEEQLAFVSSRSDSDQIYVMPVSGGAPQQLTYHTEGYALLEWYPDGQSLLTQATRDHFWRRPERFFQIKTEPRTGEHLLFDAYGSNGTLSADGKRLLFTREGTRWWRKGYHGSQASQIWLYEFSSGKFKQVVKNDAGCRSPLWHPDSKKFYYVSGQSGSFNLWERDLASAKETQLTDFSDDSVSFPCVSRDGSTIVFRHLFDLYRLRPGTGKRPEKLKISYKGDVSREPTMRRTLKSATEVAFSKDGLEVAFIAGGDVWVMDTELREPKQVTNTAEEERDLLFAPDGETLIFASDMGEQCDIWQATRENSKKYWWQNDQFTLKRLTNDTEVETGLSFSPTGDHVAYLRTRGDLWIMSPDGTGKRRIFTSWNEPDYDWSPDGKWLTYAVSDSDFNRDVFVAPIDGSREPFNLSMHPDNDYAPVWSPDGSMIAFTARHITDEVDIHYVDLLAEKSEETSRDRKLKKAIEKLQKARKSKSSGAATKTAEPAASAQPEGAAKPAAKTPPPAKKPTTKPASKEVPDNAGNAAPAAAGAVAPPKPVVIDFEGIHDRIHRVSIPNSTESGLFWSHDSKRLAFQATVDAKPGTYTISPPEDLKPKLLTAQTGSQATWISQGNQILWLVSGTPASFSTSSSHGTSYSFRVAQAVDVGLRYETTFMQCWRAMRDNFYDGRLNNRNWDSIYRKYAPMARISVDTAMLGNIVSMMLGELNGSHLGFYVTSGTRRRGRSDSPDSSDKWRETTAHLGLRFDATFRGPGLKVRDIILHGPCDKTVSRVKPAEILLSVDGTAVDPDMDMTTVLNGRLDRDMTLRIKGTKGAERDVVIRPTSYSAVRSTLYEMWVRHNRELVSKASGGKLGYLHIQGMNMPSFYRFEQELYEVGVGKDGLVIDVRENGGGSTTDRLLTALTQPQHALTLPRGGKQAGYPQDRTVYATWNKPIVAMCNQNSFSNAEIFSHAIKTLKRGHLVGVRTSGSVISTGATQIMDLGFLRMPFRGWFLINSGLDMEQNGAVPDFEVWPQPAELPAGKDRQLDKAVQVLKADVQKWKQRKQPKLQTAAELRAAAK